MSVEFNFEDKEWQRFLKKLQIKWKDIENRKSFAVLASGIAFGDIIEHFDKEQGPDGKWVKWSEIYEQHLKRIGRSGNKKLNFSGTLRRSFLPGQQKVTPNNLGVLLYSDVEYAATHEYGDKTKNIPARKFMYLSKDGMDRLVFNTAQWLSEDL